MLHYAATAGDTPYRGCRGRPLLYDKHVMAGLGGRRIRPRVRLAQCWVVERTFVRIQVGSVRVLLLCRDVDQYLLTVIKDRMRSFGMGTTSLNNHFLLSLILRHLDETAIKDH